MPDLEEELRSYGVSESTILIEVAREELNAAELAWWWVLAPNHYPSLPRKNKEEATKRLAEARVSYTHARINQANPKRFV